MTIDDTLSALAMSDVHPGLDGIGPGVRARIAADARSRRQARHGMLAAIGAATLAGVGAAAIPVAPATEAFALLPTSLAPSTLLVGE